MTSERAECGRVDDLASSRVCPVADAALKVDEYVLATKYSDADPHDPWFVGYLDQIITDKKGTYVTFAATGMKAFNHVVRLTGEEGGAILERFKAGKCKCGIECYFSEFI